MLRIMPCNLLSTSSRLQLIRRLFWLISNPDVATPPALLALPGLNRIRAACNASIASGVEGMLAPSATHFTPFLISVWASSPFNSFWVAQGRAMSQGTPHGRPSWKVAPLKFSAYSLMRPLRLFLRSIIQASLVSSIPLGS